MRVLGRRGCRALGSRLAISLGLAATAAAAAPTKSSFQPVDLPLSAAISVNTVGVGFDGTSSMLFWSDSGDLYGTLLAAGGAVIPGGKLLDSPFGSSGSLADPVTAFGGGLHVVGYRDGDDVIVARVAPDGTLIGSPDSIATGFSGNPNGAPRVASDGYLTAVVWRHVSQGAGYSDASGVKALLLAPDGSSRSVEVDDGGALTSLGEVAVAHDGQHFVIAWEGAGASMSRLMSGVVTEAPVSLAGNVLDLTATRDANGATFAWVDVDNADALTTRHVDPTGTLGDPVAAITGAGSRSDTLLAFDGSDRVLGWCEQPSTSRATRLSADGSSADVDGYAVGAPGWCSRALAAADGGFVQFRTNGEIARFAADGTGNEISWVRDAKFNTQSDPVIAFDGQQHLVVWKDTRVGGPGLFAVRVGPKGRVLDAPALSLSGVTTTDKYDVAASPSGGFLVVWSAQSSVRAVRVAANGAVLDASPITIGSDGDVGSVRVAGDPQGYLVSWSSHENNSVELVGARVLNDGTPSAAQGTPLLGPKGSEPDTGAWALEYDGVGYQVVWAATGSELSAMKLALSGAPSGTKQAIGAQGIPRLGCGSVCLLVWTAAGQDRGVRLAADGSLLDPAGGVVLNAGPVQSARAVTWNGSSFLVSTKYTFETRAIRVSAAGTVLDAQPFNVAPFINDLDAHAVAPAPGGWLLVTDELDDQLGVARAGFWRLDETCETAADGTACDDGNACSYGDVCAAGLCKGTVYSCGSTDPCSTGLCAGDGTCTSVPNEDSCDDGDPCTADDRCKAGTCAGVAYSCDTGKPCTAGATCDSKGGCNYSTNGTSCDDGVPCSNADTCTQGVCIGELDWECHIPGSTQSTGGSAGASGAAGSAGAGGTGAGFGGAAAGSAGPGSGSDDSGCGCRVPTRRAPGSTALAAALLALLALGRSRRLVR